MRNDQTILAELESQRNLYRANVDKWKRSQIEESNAKVNALMQEYNDFFTEGAVIPEHIKPYMIGGLHGMKRANGQFEIGASVRGQKAGKDIITGLASRGETREQAVSNWNNGIYV
jgi:hypothetical protein